MLLEGITIGTKLILYLYHIIFFRTVAIFNDANFIFYLKEVLITVVQN